MKHLTQRGSCLEPRRAVLWVAWERHRRTVELSRYLHIDLIAYSSVKSRWIRHPFFIMKTVTALFRQQPVVLIVQSPSVVLSLLACLLKRVFCYRLIIDAHNAAVLPDHPCLRMLSFLYRYPQRAADLTVVTNPELAGIVAANGGAPFVLPDCLPSASTPTSKKRLEGTFNVVYICTFGADEPYQQLIEAARRFPREVRFHITGNCRKIQGTSVYRGKPDNVTFTGFIPDEEYWQLLASADLVVDLTLRDACLVCGAYEAVAAGVPALLSDSQALREYFYKGMIFTGSEVHELAQNISYAMRRIDILKKDVAELKIELEANWAKVADVFRSRLGTLTLPPR